MKRRSRLAVVCTGVLLAAVAPARGQQPQNERLITADGVRLDYPPDGVWRVRARRVAEQRARLRSQGRMDALNAPALGRAAQPSEAAVEGDLWVPSILVAYLDTDTSALPFKAVHYDSVFYTTQPLANRPYTQRTFYEEMSNQRLHVRGQAYGWMKGGFAQTYYLDACGTAANALDCSAGRSRMWQLFTSALAGLDSAVDFGQYDNDGPDGVPNSGDDDGIVDVVQFVQPVVGGECSGRGVWAHKYTLQWIGGLYSTNDLVAGGADAIRVGPYHLVGGVGGVQCTTTSEIMGIGTASHELGHGLGLPDLYDVSGQTQGVGEWGLMGSANYRSLVSPGHFEAWSKEQLGWVVVRELTATATYQIGPVVTGDTILMIRPRGSNPRGEYWLVENKQAVGSDVVNMLESGTRSKRGGLAVWHVDSLKVAAARAGNFVNAGVPHGVALVQADGLGHLDVSTGGNRGDAGDAYPGNTTNHAYSRTTSPAAVKNYDGAFARFGVLGIAQDVPNGAMSLRFGYATVIRASDTLAFISVSDSAYHRYEDVLSPDSATTVSVADFQSSQDGRARFTFSSWSDGGGRTHTINAGTVPDSLVAALDAEYQLLVTRTGTGTIAASPAAELEIGTFFGSGTSVTLVATSGPDSVFDGWLGDTITISDTLVLMMRRPYSLQARFVGALVGSAAGAPAAIMGAPYTYDIPAQGGTGSYQWSVAGGQLPPGMYLVGNGRIGGTPEAVGTFDVTLSVRSGSQLVSVPAVLTVDAPVIALEAVVGRLLKLGGVLTDNEIRYFDLLGNRNTRLDLGDFLAWVKATGIKPSAEVLARVAAAAKPETP